MYIFFLPNLLNSLEKEACLSHFSCNEHHLTCNEITHICVHVCGIQVYSEAALQLASIYIFLYQPHPASLPLIWWLFWETEAYARPHRLRNTTHCVWTCVPVYVWQQIQVTPKILSFPFDASALPFCHHYGDFSRCSFHFSLLLSL